jgi:GAF domain-containing protein/HAMP domain-containing protein
LLVSIIAGLNYFTNISIARPIEYLTQVANKISQGDLTVNIEAIKRKDEIGFLAQTFKQMTDNLVETIVKIEERIADRTRGLEVVATISEHLSGILGVNELLTEIVTQVKDEFQYYHAHIYLFDDRRENLVVAAGTGPAGAEMKAKGHTIPVNAVTSLVARAARSNKVVRVDNVREAPDWLPNDLLPNTYSEMAVPITLGGEGQVVGVLDVQEDEIGGLDEGDENLLRSLANQVAVAIRNARLFEQVETQLAEARAAQEQYLTQSWQKTKGVRHQRQYLYARPGAAPLDETKQQIFEQMQEQSATRNEPTILTANRDSKSLVAPVTLHNHTIGAIQLHNIKGQSLGEDDLAIIEAVVDQLAQSAENLRLFDAIHERASREQTIREITDKLRAAPNLERLVTLATEELGRRLSATHAELELGLEPGQPAAGNGYQAQN